MRIPKKIIGVCGALGLLFGGTTTFAQISENALAAVKNEKKVTGHMQEPVLQIDSSAVKKKENYYIF